MDSSPSSLGRVVVAGGCGFLGRHIVSLILDQYPESTVAALDLHTANNRVQDRRVSYHECDITDAGKLLALFGQEAPQVVIHTAALMPNPKTTKSAIRQVNYDGTLNLLNAAKAVGVRAFVYTSSSSVIIRGTDGAANADESWPLLTGPEQPDYYSRLKALAEKAVIEANRSLPTFLTAAIRPAGIYGEYDTQLSYRSLLIRGFSTYIQLGDNTNLFDATYVGNVAHAHLLAVRALLQTDQKHVHDERADGEAFIVTNGEPVYFWDLLRRMWQARGWPEDKIYNVRKVWGLSAGWAMFLALLAEVVCGLVGKVPNFTRNAVKNAIMTRYFCIDKARKRLGYVPLWTLEEGIERGVKVNTAIIKKQTEANKTR